MEYEKQVLLCTFGKKDNLDNIIELSQKTYVIANNTIYILENIQYPSLICCTYNVIFPKVGELKISDSTISLHRKKITNTLYSINALNSLIKELNNGVLDTKFSIPWEDYKNTILVTAYDKLKRIDTKLFKIVKLEA